MFGLHFLHCLNFISLSPIFLNSLGHFIPKISFWCFLVSLGRSFISTIFFNISLFCISSFLPHFVTTDRFFFQPWYTWLSLLLEVEDLVCYSSWFHSSKVTIEESFLFLGSEFFKHLTQLFVSFVFKLMCCYIPRSQDFP